jgi:hypothetical protein
MAVCTEVVPPELTFDGVRVACHLYRADGDGIPVEAPTLAQVGVAVDSPAEGAA